jgi:hypothetical protein
MARLFLPALLLAGCGNACQQLCDNLADFAASECAMTVDPDEVSTCREAYAGQSLAEGDAQACAASNDPEYIREWWTCDDLAENFANGTN